MLAALLLAGGLLAGCGEQGADTATDPAASPAAMPTAIPAAAGPVTTRTLATVMDTGSPELCLGPVAESWPPQCGGPPIAGWAWADHRGTFEHQGTIRWGQFSVTGTWDGATFTYRGAIPAALYDPAAPETPTYPEPAVVHSDRELEDIAAQVGDLPGAQGAYADADHVLVDVVYDDGSLQAWVDDTYGEDVVVVTSALVDE